MTEEADPRGAAKSALSIAAIILCVITIGVVTAFFMTRVKPENNCEPIANTQQVDSKNANIGITEARRMFEDFVFYAGQNPVLLTRQLFPEATITHEIGEMGYHLVRTDIDYSEFLSAYNNYIDKDLQTLYPQGQITGSTLGYANCDGKFCINIGTGSTERSEYYRGVIEDFWQSGDNSFEATVHSILVDIEDVPTSSQAEHYVMEFTPNDNGGFKFTKLEIN